jgi:hypothetical protein
MNDEELNAQYEREKAEEVELDAQAKAAFQSRFPNATPLPLPGAEAPPKDLKVRVGFDIDDVLVKNTTPYAYSWNPDSYTKLPLFAVFEALVVDPGFIVHVITGRTMDSIPIDIQDNIKAMEAGGQCFLIARDWDHPVDRLQPADFARRGWFEGDEINLTKPLEADYLQKYEDWKARVVSELQLDIYFDDRTIHERECGWARKLATQFCHVR